MDVGITHGMIFSKSSKETPPFKFSSIEQPRAPRCCEKKTHLLNIMSVHLFHLIRSNCSTYSCCFLLKRRIFHDPTHHLSLNTSGTFLSSLPLLYLYYVLLCVAFFKGFEMCQRAIWRAEKGLQNTNQSQGLQKNKNKKIKKSQFHSHRHFFSGIQYFTHDNSLHSQRFVPPIIPSQIRKNVINALSSAILCFCEVHFPGRKKRVHCSQ